MVIMLNHGYSTDLVNLLVDGDEAQGFPKKAPVVPRLASRTPAVNS
jgi:hypothetical protein